MNKELQKYYEERFSMFATQGWIDFIEDIEARISAVSSIKGIKDIETLCARQGELDTLEWIKSLPEISKQVFEQLQGEDSASV